MTTRSKAQDGPSSPPTSSHEIIRPGRAEEVAEPTETSMLIPKKQDPNPEEPVHWHDNDTEQASHSNASASALGDFGKEDNEYISGYKLFAALFGIASVFFIVLLDFSIIATAIPCITSEFHSLQDIGWYGGAYVLTSAALQPLTGKLYTYLNVKHMFLFFVVIFEVGSLLCAISTSSTVFILGRTVAGMGSSGLENGALTLIAGAVPLHERPFYNGIVFGGIVLGPLIGGALTQYASWRWCFLINLPIGAVSGLFLIFTHIPDVTIKPPFSFALLRSIVPNLDLVGFALFVPTTVMFLLALQWGSTEYGWNSPTVISLFVGSGGTLIGFSLWQWHMGEGALIPFHLVKRRVVWASILHSSSLFVNNFVGVNYIPIYFQAVKGVGPSLSGFYTLPAILTQVLALVTSGALMSRIGYYLPFSIVAGAATAIACGLISTWNPDTSTPQWVGYQMLFGLRGMGLQTGVIAIQNAVAPGQSPTVIGFMVFVENMMAAIFTIVGSVIFTETLKEQVPMLAPSVSPEAALAAGGSAEAVRALLPPGSPELYGLLLAFSNSVDAVFFTLAALPIVSFIAAWGMGWVNIRKKTPAEDGA